MRQTIVEAETKTGKAVRRLGVFATFADAYGYATTRLGLEELDIRHPGVWILPGGERAIFIEGTVDEVMQ